MGQIISNFITVGIPTVYHKLCSYIPMTKNDEYMETEDENINRYHRRNAICNLVD